MSDEIDWERLARFVSGGSSADESAAVEHWMSGDPERRALVAQMERRWKGAATTEEWDVDRAWSRMSARLHERSSVAPVATPAGVTSISSARSVVTAASRRAGTTTSAWWMRAAAAIVVVAGAAAAWRAASRSPAATTAAGVTTASIVERTEIGEQRAISLGDGSSATLGPSSELRVAIATTGVREVYLQGEAVFTVVHDAARPFRVHAGNVVTEDLGTSFGVRAYRGEQAVRVAVSEGSVALRRDGETGSEGAVLRARDVARLAKGGAPQISHDQPVERMLAWTSGELVFEDTPLSDVVSELERWYDVDIQLGEPQLAARPLTATLKRGEAIDEVLRVIGLSLSLRVEHTGREVMLRSAGRAATDQLAPAVRRAEAGA